MNFTGISNIFFQKDIGIFQIIIRNSPKTNVKGYFSIQKEEEKEISCHF